MKRMSALLAALLLLAALAGAIDPKAEKAPSSTTKQADEVRAAELAFAASAKAKDLEKFLSFVDDDVHFFIAGKMVTGKEKERENWTRIFADTTMSIVWHPEIVEASGGLGYTTGPFEITKAGTMVRKGRYATVWRRKSDGSWKVALDVGVDEPQPDKK
jgi:ketosteroid isomerase-like protein